ncbi:MAG: R3H domain-containing nucleic acid-binding protein [Acidobacteriota bacterium]
MSEDAISKIVEFTNRILRLSGLDLKATAERTEDAYRIELRGGDIHLLLGHNAELLEALEYLATRLLARDSEEEIQILFDSNHYRARREKELRLMAEKAAERVRATRIPFTFDPMSPSERRILHLALSEDKSVKTESQGGGENRKVVVYPA